jgi:hypothetical protein
MQRTLASLVALCCIATAAYAQSASIKLTAEDTHTIKEIVLKESNFPKTAAADYKVGDQAPASVTLQTFPQLVAEKISAAKSHKFFLSGDKVVVVDPKDNKIAEIIE